METDRPGVEANSPLVPASQEAVQDESKQTDAHSNSVNVMLGADKKSNKSTQVSYTLQTILSSTNVVSKRQETEQVASGMNTRETDIQVIIIVNSLIQTITRKTLLHLQPGCVDLLSHNRYIHTSIYIGMVGKHYIYCNYRQLLQNREHEINIGNMQFP